MHGLLENLVARADEPEVDGAERLAVVAGGRRLAALKALIEDGTIDDDHPMPCNIYTGMRREEVLTLHWERVDLTALTFRVEDTKTRLSQPMPWYWKAHRRHAQAR